MLCRQLEKGLQLDNNQIAALQHENAKKITALTYSASVSLSTMRCSVRILLTLPQFLGVISTTAAIFSIDSVVAAPGAVVGVVMAILAGLLLIFAVVLQWHTKLVEPSARTTPFWIWMGRWVDTTFTQPSKTMASNNALSVNIQMEQLLNSNSTAV